MKLNGPSIGRIAAHMLGALMLAALLLSSCARENAGDTPADSVQNDVAPATIDTPSTATTSQPTDSGAVVPTETEVRSAMQEKFDAMGGMDRVRIDVSGSTVVLEGTVTSSDRKQTAEDVARAVPGVVSVENRIEVGEK
jgi:hypothetical protein